MGKSSLATNIAFNCAERLLRDLRAAAQSVNALVTALERRPNSVLFGR